MAERGPRDYGVDPAQRSSRWTSPGQDEAAANARDEATGELESFESAEIADEIRFQKQCFLSYNLLKIIEKAQSTALGALAGNDTDGLANTNAFPQVTSLANGYMTRPSWTHSVRGAFPSDITSLFVSRPDIQALFEMKPALMSYLVPYVRFFKVFYTNVDTDDPESAMQRAQNEQEIELIFDDFTRPNEVEDILATGAGRAGGVGLKSFSWEFLGVNPAEVENNIKARLSLYFNEIADFERLRVAKEGPAVSPWHYRFSDLVVPEPMYVKAASDDGFRRLRDSYNPDFFRIKVVAGWNVDPHGDARGLADSLLPETFKRQGKSWPDFVELIEKCRKVMYLNLISHDIVFANDGSIELNAEYQAYAEGILSIPESDILQVGRVREITNLGRTGRERNWSQQIGQREERLEEIARNVRLMNDVSAGRCSAQEITVDYTDSDGASTQHVFAAGRGENDRPRDRTRADALEEVSFVLSQETQSLHQQINHLNRIDRSLAHARIVEKLLLSNRIYRIVVHRRALGFSSVEEGDASEVPPLQDTEQLREQHLSPGARRSRYSVQTGEESLDLSSLEEQDIDIALARRMIAAGRLEGSYDFDFEDSMFLLVPRRPGTGASAQLYPSVSMRMPLEMLHRGILPEEAIPIDGLISTRTRLGPGSSGNPWAFPHQDAGDAGILADDTTLNEAAERNRRMVVWNTEVGDYSALGSLVAGQPGSWVGSFVKRKIEQDKIGIDFMFLGDILDVVMSSTVDIIGAGNRPPSGLLHDMAGFRSWLSDSGVSLMLGTFVYNDPAQYKAQSAENNDILPKYVNLADIPVSIELFSAWFTQEIIAKNRERMTLKAFITSVFDKLLINSFGSDCVFDPEGSFTLAQEGLRVTPEFYTVSNDNLSNAGFMIPESTETSNQLGRNVLHRDILTTLREGEFSMADYEPGLGYGDYRNVILYQAKGKDAWGNIFENDVRSGYIDVADNDIKNGVYHLNLGSDRGLVKTISFSRIDQAYLRESRIERTNELGSFDQLRERYNATVSLYGNMLFYPGQYIFINPSMVGENIIQDAEALTTKLGIGGYFLITKVENIVEVGNFETILTCSWVYSGFPTEYVNTIRCAGVSEQSGQEERTFNMTNPLRR